MTSESGEVSSRLHAAWEITISLVTVYAAIEVPLAMVMEAPRTGWLLASEIAVTAVFAADLLYRLRRYREAGATRHYLRRWFAIDFAATIPFGTLVGVPFGALRLLRLLRLAKLIRVSQSARALRNSWNAVNPSLLRMAVLVFWIIMTAHFVTVGWLLVGGASDPGLTPPEQYLRGMYWTSTTLTTIGYGDITPVGTVQILYTILVQILGAGLYGFVIGTIATLIANIDVAKSSFQDRLERIQTFLRFRDIPPDLQHRVRNYFDYLWESRRGYEEKDILGDLPENLRTEIAYHINKDVLEKVPILKGVGEELLRDIVSKLEPVVFLPGDIIVRQGETGREMYFISRGTVDVVSGDMTTVYATLTEGQFFGEIALLLSTERTATIRANDYCDLYRLNQETFSSILERYPDFAASIRTMAEQRKRELGL